MCQKEKSAGSDRNTEELYKRFSQKHQQLAEFLLDHFSEELPRDNARSAAVSGQRLKVLARIVGGVPALEGEFNECCLIGSRNVNGTIDWFCTGVLIHRQVVISAAHCIKPGKGYVVALGTNNQNNLAKAEILNVRKATVHPDYFKTNKLNDISVLVLQTPAKTAPVPTASAADMQNASQVMLVGFGNDDIKSTKGFGLKRKVEVDIISIRRAPNEDLNADEAMFGYESDLEFVAGGRGFDTCNGDSGGPAYIMDGARRVVAGLTSRSTDNAVNPCGDGGIYTRVDVHQDFIDSFINK
jgi:endonuclease G